MIKMKFSQISLLLVCLTMYTLNIHCQTNFNCISATQVCNDATIVDNFSANTTNVPTNTGCLFLSPTPKVSWFKLDIVANGVLQFLIIPNNVTNYNFALYGPNVLCETLGAPIRCSYADISTSNPCGGTSTPNATGLSPCSVENSENLVDDGYVRTINVFAGQTYFLMVQNWNDDFHSFSLNFSGTTAGIIGCLPLSVSPDSIKIEPTLPIQDSALFVFPTITTGMITFSESNLNICITDNVGRIIYQTFLTTTSLDLNNMNVNMPNGVYNITIVQKAAKINTKIILQK